MFKFGLEAQPNEYTASTEALKKLIRVYYPSNIIGCRIVNAKTGQVYPHNVGSKDEQQYFRVIDATGRVDKNGKRLEVHCNNPNPNKLFYESRDEYMSHRHSHDPEFVD